MELLYNKNDDDIGNQALFSGTISAIKWNTAFHE
jgi:hypothetical protein